LNTGSRQWRGITMIVKVNNVLFFSIVLDIEVYLQFMLIHDLKALYMFVTSLDPVSIQQSLQDE